MKLRPWEYAVIGALGYEGPAFLTTGIVQWIAIFLFFVCVGGMVGGLLVDIGLLFNHCIYLYETRRNKGGPHDHH